MQRCSENEGEKIGLKYFYYMVVVHIQTSQKGRPEDVQMTDVRGQSRKKFSIIRDFPPKLL